MKTLRASSAAPGSWWLLALSLTVLAGVNPNWWVQLAVALLAVVLTLALREDNPWSRSMTFYLALAGIVVLVRVLFRVIFNTEDSSAITVISLPRLDLDLGFGPQVSLLGDVSYLALLSGLTDGLRLAAIILCVAMASSLANPRQLLRSTPGVLYEVASAISVAINLAPQIITSLQRVRKAKALRGRSRGLGKLAGIIVPVLEDAVDASVALAASLDSRGFGRRGGLSKKSLALTRASSLLAIACFGIGGFLLLVGDSNWIGLLIIAIGLFSSVLAIRISSKAKLRTRLEPVRLRAMDFALFSSSLALIAIGILGTGS